LKNVRLIRSLAARYKLVLVPGTFPVGYSNDLLALQPSLAEGLSVRDVPFVVRGGIAHLAADPSLHLPAHPTWMDKSVRLSQGVAMVNNPTGNARLVFKMTLHPFWSYHLRVWIRTRHFTGRPHLEVLAGPHNRSLQYQSLSTRPSQKWRRYDVVFDTLQHRNVRIYFGSWGAARGMLEWRAWTIHVAGLVNVLSRRGAPTTVAGYRPGIDFIVPHDPLLGQSPYAGEYTSWHRPAILQFRRPMPNGKVVHVSWYYPPIFYHGQVTGAIESPRFIQLLAAQAARVGRLFQSGHYMLNIDELRAAGWDLDGAPRKQSPGALLAHVVRVGQHLFRGAKIYVWSDMFDPFHNAQKKYFLVNGSLRQSWRGLNRRTVIINWGSPHKRRSLRFFARLGNRQIVAAYYDAPLTQTAAWLRAARGVPGVIGYMYTTWRGDYRKLAAFASLVRRGYR
jgi:hypothetical protein